MPWVRLDDGYPEHPKVDRVGPLAAWLNVCAWAYSARNLTDGFVPAERVARLAQVHNPKQLATALMGAELWESTSAPCPKCVAKRVEVHAPTTTGDGFLIHDYLFYNPSREQVLKERAESAQRAADYRARRTNGVSAPVTNGVTDDVTNTVTHGVSASPPVPGPVNNAPNGAAHKPVPKPNRSAEVIDALRAVGIEPTMTARDHAALKTSTAKPELVAEVYQAVFSGKYGDAYMQRHLTVHDAIGWIDGYRAWRTNGGPPRYPNRSTPEPARRLIDKTGVEN